jgi:hypothetical protein
MSANTQSGNPITPYANLNDAVPFYGQGGGSGPSGGVTQILAGTGISINPVGGTGNVTITSTGTSGVSSIAGTANEVSVSAATGAVTVSLPLQIKVNSVIPSTTDTLSVGPSLQLTTNGASGNQATRLNVAAGGTFNIPGNKCFFTTPGTQAFTIQPPAAVVSGGNAFCIIQTANATSPNNWNTSLILGGGPYVDPGGGTVGYIGNILWI